MNYNHSIMSKNIENIKKIMKTDCASWNTRRFEDDIFDYLVVNKTNTNNYVSGNFAFMLITLPRIMNDYYSFNDNETIRMYEVYCILTEQIEIKDFYIYDMKKINEIIKTRESLIPIFYVKKKSLNLNEMTYDKIKKICKYSDSLEKLLSRKLKLHSVFYQHTDNIYSQEKQIVYNMKEKYDNVLKRTKSNLLNEITDINLISV